MALNLSPGEQIVFEGHPSWRSILDFYAKGIGLTILAAVIADLVTRIGGDVKTSVVVIVAVIGVALTVLVGFIRRVTTSYTITNRRLHIRRGIVSRTIQETRLDRVQNVNYTQGFFQRILQIGNVDFDTAGGGDYDFTFAGVAQPEEVVQRVDSVHEAAAGSSGQEPPQQAPGQV